MLMKLLFDSQNPSKHRLIESKRKEKNIQFNHSVLFDLKQRVIKIERTTR